MSRRSARSILIRNLSLELLQDLVSHGIRKSTFQHLTVNWNLNVLEMALKTFRFVQGLPITPFIVPSIFQKHYIKFIYSFRNYGHLKISKFEKDARRKIIEICLVRSASTSVVC